MSADTWAEAMREHERSLVVGARVRVRLSECGWLNATDYTDHTLSVNGATGVVRQVDPPDTHRDEHRFVVCFDAPWPSGRVACQDQPIASGYFCAAELIPEPAPAGPERGETD